MDPIYHHFAKGFERAIAARNGSERRIGAELKFPLVNDDGTAVRFETACELWEYLQEKGWHPDLDPTTGAVVGARKRGERNDTVASCETGFCKAEFSLAHVADLFALDQEIVDLRGELAPFAQEHQVHFLGYGIQPVTPPSQRLLMKKGRTSVWDAFASNRHIPEERGNDMHLFTINAATHVHVSVSADEAIRAVNVLNGFAAAQIALTANSSVWQGQVDPHYKCVAEKFWDWWLPDGERVGIPPEPFADLQHYVHSIARLKPVYVKREGQPILLTGHETFRDYYEAGEPLGTDLNGQSVPLVPESEDIDLHGTCYWYNARLSHYYTVENRVCDQQPPEHLVCVAALTLGLLAALDEAAEELDAHDWSALREARDTACRDGLAGRVGGLSLADLADRMLSLARTGLQRRGLGEEAFLDPLWTRLQARFCPADQAVELFRAGGIGTLLAARKL